ncbi:response regulator [Polaribacter litorisediminis]|uniref:response regulator n=1 Tax=Polaribacter litorisediminis TaxID=1908341 RepID=UPI001CC1A080|nr:response regulator [Polaribacter litorisediminis]
MIPKIKRFLLVDDDPINNLLTKIVIEKSFKKAHIHAFTMPEDGLAFIKSAPNNQPIEGKTILFLDINMPVLSGWDCLEAFELFDPSIKDNYNIYILSSSVDPKDINRAKENPLIIDFIEKPLNRAKLADMFQ